MIMMYSTKNDNRVIYAKEVSKADRLKTASLFRAVRFKIAMVFLMVALFSVTNLCVSVHASGEDPPYGERAIWAKPVEGTPFFKSEIDSPDHIYKKCSGSSIVIQFDLKIREYDLGIWHDWSWLEHGFQDCQWRNPASTWSSTGGCTKILDGDMWARYEFDEPGHYTVKGRHRGYECASPYNITGGDVTVHIYVVEVTDIDVVSGATDIDDGASTPDNTDVCAAIKDAGDVVLVAHTNPTVVEAYLPDNFVSWWGGDVYPGHQLFRKVSKSSWAKHEVIADIGDSTATMLTYIIGSEYTDIQRLMGEESFEDDEMAYKADPVGMIDPNPATGVFESNIQIQFTVRPDSLITDGNAGLFNINDIKWDVSRYAYFYLWLHNSGVWTIEDDSGGQWISDDSVHDDEDNNPWNGNGHLYANDSPGTKQEAAADWVVMKANMKEWVRVGLGGTLGENGSLCSEYVDWRAFRSVRKVNDVWHNDNTYDNELVEGNLFWGNVPSN